MTARPVRWARRVVLQNFSKPVSVCCFITISAPLINQASAGGVNQSFPKKVVQAKPALRAGLIQTFGGILGNQRRKCRNVTEENMKIRPEIIISTIDADRLDKLMDSMPGRSFMGKAELESELARARVVDPKDVPPTVVTMNSTVRFRVESSSEEFELTLVYPKDVDASGKTISILAPVGSALLGLSQGDEIEWPKPGGGVLRVHISEVTYQPERAGEFHR